MTIRDRNGKQQGAGNADGTGSTETGADALDDRALDAVQGGKDSGDAHLDYIRAGTPPRTLGKL